MRKLAAAGFLLIWSVLHAATGGDAEKGNEVFDEQCSSCHNAYSTDSKAGPGLQFLFGRDKLSTGKPPSESNVLEIIEKGAAKMPAFKDTLSREDKDDLIAYLKTL